MAEQKQDKMVVLATHGFEDTHRASLPFVLGNAALIMEAEVTVVLHDHAVLLAKKGCFEHVFAPGHDPLAKLLADFAELGGRLWVCTPCMKVREITEDMLVEIAKPVTAGKVAHACLEANATLNF